MNQTLSIKLKILGFVLCLLSIVPWVNASETLHLNQAQFLFSPDMSPPDFADAKPISMPHKWDAEEALSGWYQFIFDIKNIHSEIYAVYLPSLNMNAEVFLNGEIIGSGGRMVSPVSRHWHEPLLFTFPNQRLKQGKNILYIHIASAWPNTYGHLAQPSLGLSQELQPIYDIHYFEKHTLYVISILLSLIVGLLMMYLWYLRRQREYFWFALAAIIWAISSLDLVVTTIPVSTYTWQIMILWLVGWMPVPLAFFLYGIMRINIGKLGKFVSACGFIIFLILWLVPTSMVYPVIFVWFSLTMMIGAHTIYLLFQNRVQVKARNQAMYKLLLASITICYVMAIHDFLYVIEALDASSQLWLGFAIPTMLITISILLVRQFAQAMQDIEQVSLTLRTQVQEAEQRIKEDYALITKLESESAVVDERQRIFSDLHDDLGAKLLSLIYKSETPEQKMLAKKAMDGLREIVKHNPTEPNTYSAPLLAWRIECQKRALEHQAQLKWHQTRITDVYEIPADTSIQISMVLKEALSNALKHGDGKDIRVRVQVRFGRLFMSVRNQRNQVFVEHKHGRGKHSMRHRVQQLGGKIRWKDSKKGGCHVAWMVPLVSEA